MLWKKIYSLSLFKIIIVFRPGTPFRMFICRIRIELLLDVTHHQNIESSHLSSCLSLSLSWFQTTCWKKVSLITFRQILPKTLLAVHIFSFIIITFLKKFIEIKSLMIKQYLVELSPWIIPPASLILPKMLILLLCCLLPLSCIDFPANFPNLPFRGNPVNGEKIQPSSKNNAHFSHQKYSPHQIAVFR